MKHAQNDDPDCGKIRVFVYGSLKRGQPNGIILRNCINAKCMGLESITGKYAMLSLGTFPGVFTQPAKCPDLTIYGELWMGDDEMLHALDILEGHPNFYERRKVVGNQAGKRMWVYFLPPHWEKEAEDVVEYSCWRTSNRELDYWGKTKVGSVFNFEENKNRA